MDLIKTVLNSWKFWLVLAIVIVAYWIYSAGKQVGQDTPPVDAPYPNSGSQSNADKIIFEAWAKKEGNDLVEYAKKVFGEWSQTWWSSGVRTIADKLINATDNQIIWVNNTFNKRYFKMGTFLRLCQHNAPYWGDDNWVDLEKRMIKLGLK